MNRKVSNFTYFNIDAKIENEKKEIQKQLAEAHITIKQQTTKILQLRETVFK